MTMATVDKPIWRLTDEDLNALSPQERQWAVNHLGFLKETGTLAVILANPEGARFETVWDKALGWKVQPLPDPARQALADIIWGLAEEEARLHYFVLNWPKTPDEAWS